MRSRCLWEQRRLWRARGSCCPDSSRARHHAARRFLPSPLAGRSEGGNLYITWREDMVEALRPLVSAWVDVLCTSILSLPEDRNRRLWAFLDELPSLEKLPSLIDAATKGRKMGLRLVTAFSRPPSSTISMGRTRRRSCVAASGRSWCSAVPRQTRKHART